MTSQREPIFLAEDQLFVDGNKRTAVHTALVLLGLNGFLLADPDGRLYDAVIALSSRELDKQGLASLMRVLAVPSRIAEED